MRFRDLIAPVRQKDSALPRSQKRLVGQAHPIERKSGTSFEAWQAQQQPPSRRKPLATAEPDRVWVRTDAQAFPIRHLGLVRRPIAFHNAPSHRADDCTDRKSTRLNS